MFPRAKGPLSEVDVETSGIRDFLRESGYRVTSRKTGITELDAAWPTKKKGGTGTGQPDLFLFATNDKTEYPICVWENKGTAIGVDVALAEAKGYVEGAHRLLRGKPNLPRIAVGYDGDNLRAAYFTPDSKWITLKVAGKVVMDGFPPRSALERGVRTDGSVLEPSEQLDARVLRSVFDQLKTLYRGVPALKSGRRPIDFTVALLTLRLLVERKKWGSWSEQPSLLPDATDQDQQIAERFRQLVARCMSTSDLRDSYGSIFKFTEQDETESEVAFDFEAVLKGIPTGKGFYKRMFDLIDTLPLLHGADIDIFGEVYQSIGDDAVKKTFGEYFTGRHIIAGIVPAFLARAGVSSFDANLKGKKIADVACGTGGFLTESLRFVRREFDLDQEAASAFAENSFYGYDLSASNASRARVNMYFAGDGFSVIEGGVDSLDPKAKNGPGKKSFDFILTNPPYGSSSQHHLVHEAFLSRVIELLEPATGWGLVVMPTGSFENPRSAGARLNLLKNAQVTDVISLPKHAFAPYTTQRTAVVFFRRRATPLSATTWEDVLKSVGNEKISMFLVDNDGFANSDKRFPTRRQNLDGSWAHDDLAAWTDLGGLKQPGRLFNSLINEIDPGDTGSGTKYARHSLNDLSASMTKWGADRGSGVELLPDRFLRSDTTKMTPEVFQSRVKTLALRLKGGAFEEGRSVSEELKELLQSPITFDDGTSDRHLLTDLFIVKKGNTSLTEEAIYNAHQIDGLPVYGGGVSRPSHHIRADARTAAGKPVTIFDGPAIVVSVDGSSGAMQVVQKGKFACNHHAVVLVAKTSHVNLDLYAQQAESRLRGLASNKGASATLTMGTLRSLEVDLPTDPNLATALGSARAQLTQMRRLLG